MYRLGGKVYESGASECIRPKGASTAKKKGFTLFEVLVASTILVAVIAFVVRSARLGNLSVETADLTTLATQYLQDEAERVRAFNWTELINTPLEEVIDDAPAHFTTSKIADNRITMTREIRDLTAEGYIDMREVTLTATWDSWTGRTSSRRLIFRYARDGIYDYYYGSE